MATRFWSKVEKKGPDDCWEWGGATYKNGYGYLAGTRGERSVRAHRLSYELHFNSPGDLCVLHKCDNPPCVNPNHLFLGTRADNNADKHAKGRDYERSGSRNPNVKLTKDDVMQIRQLCKDGWTQQKVADKFGIAQAYVSRLSRGKTWKVEV